MHQLLKHFKDLTLHPKNANELKGLILQLAIQGKLTSNWREENKDIEPASELLKRIQKEKKQLVKNKKTRKEKLLPQLTKDEIPNELPVGWVWCRVGDLTTIKGGKRIPKGYQLSDDKTDHVYIRVTDMKNGSVNFNKLKYITDDIFEIIKAYTISKDDLYITIAGTIGDVGEIPNELDNMNLTENAAKLIIYQTDKMYMKSLLSSHICQSQFLSKVNQMAQPKLALHRIASTIIPLPPLEEQKEIVRVVEILFKEVEQLEHLTVERITLKEEFVTSALNQLTTNNAKKEWDFLQDHFKSFFNETSNIKKLRETVLQLAVQGKLTADWRVTNPDTEDASILLKRIQKEKAQLIKDKKIKKEKPLPPIEKDEIPYELPEGWVWCRIRDVSYSIVPNRDKPKSFSGDITWLTTRNLEKQSNRIHAKESDNKLSMEEVKQYNARLLPSYSVIMSCVGQFGLSAILDKEYSCNQQLHCFVPLCNVNPYYLDCLIKNGKDIYENMSSATTIAYLNKTKCDSLAIALPPLEEQKVIVEKVNALMGLCDALEEEVQQSQKHSEQLMQSCLREVFEGEKVVENV